MAEWIVAPALAASRDLPVRLTEGPGLASFRAMQGQRPVGGGIEQLGLGWPGNRTVSGIDAIGGGHRLGRPYSPAARVPNRRAHHGQFKPDLLQNTAVVLIGTFNFSARFWKPRSACICQRVAA